MPLQYSDMIVVSTRLLYKQAAHSYRSQHAMRAWALMPIFTPSLLVSHARYVTSSLALPVLWIVSDLASPHQSAC